MKRKRIKSTGPYRGCLACGKVFTGQRSLELLQHHITNAVVLCSIVRDSVFLQKVTKVIDLSFSVSRKY